MITYPSIFRIISYLWGGKTLMRAWQNGVLESLAVTGTVLDVAGGSSPSYEPVFNNPVSKYIRADIDALKVPDLVFNAAEAWPVENTTYDWVVLMNCLYVFEDPASVLKEARRVLHPEGKLVLTLPFLWHYIPEPTDLWRFTEEGIHTLLSKAGLKASSVVQIGSRFTTALEVLAPYLHRLYCYKICALAAYYLDRWDMKKSPRRAAPLFLIIAEKALHESPSRQ